MTSSTRAAAVTHVSSTPTALAAGQPGVLAVSQPVVQVESRQPLTQSQHRQLALDMPVKPTQVGPKVQHDHYAADLYAYVIRCCFRISHVTTVVHVRVVGTEWVADTDS